jgi:AcrR family transcriptional regulator
VKDDPLTTPRAELVAAAARAFAERGYHGVSMRDLARDVGRSPATFYSHFESKEALLASLQKDAFDALLFGTRDALSGVRDAAARLRVFIGTHVEYSTSNPDVFRVLVHEASALPAAAREAVRQQKIAYFELGRDIVRDLLPEGESDAEVSRSTYCLFGMLNWAYAWYVPAEHGTPEQLAETIHRIALLGIAPKRRSP